MSYSSFDLLASERAARDFTSEAASAWTWERCTQELDGDRVIITTDTRTHEGVVLAALSVEQSDKREADYIVIEAPHDERLADARWIISCATVTNVTLVDPARPLDELRSLIEGLRDVWNITDLGFVSEQCDSFRADVDRALKIVSELS